SSDDNKGVSSEGPSVTSIPKEGPSITRRSKEPILKELLKLYGYDTVEDYLPVAKSLFPKSSSKAIFQSRDTSQMGKERFDVEGYKSKMYSDDEDADGTNHAKDADGTNHSDLKLVKRGITRLYMFRRENGKPGGIKIKVTFNAFNWVSRLHRALFLSFLGDLVRKHIGLKILSWKKVDTESRDKLWDEIKEPILKELLEWYGYDTVEHYLPVAKKPIPKVIFKNPIPIKGCVLGLANVETWDNINHLVEIQADDHDLLVNSVNENDDMLGYESEKYSDDEDADGTNHAEDADGTNHSDLKLVKRGITRLYKFGREYEKPGGIKIKVTFDALNRVSGLHIALVLSFLRDLVREHIGLKILSWKKVDKESRDKLWDEITRYFDVDLTVRKLVMHHLGKLLRNFRMKLREKYILPNLNTPSKLNELPAKYSAIVKAKKWFDFVNYMTTDAYKEKSARGKMAGSKNVYHHKMGRGRYVFVKEKMVRSKIKKLKQMKNPRIEFTDDEIRSVGDKLKEAGDKIKEGTLNLDDGTDAMPIVFGKEKGGYARGVGSGITYKRRERQQKDVLVKKFSTDMTKKDVLVKKLSNEMTETNEMLSQLMNQLVAQGVQLNLSSQLHVASDSSVVIRDQDARIQKKSNGLVTSKKEPVKTVEPKKTPKSRRNGSQDYQLQGNVSPTKELLTTSKCKLWHLKKSSIVALGTVYKSDGKQMPHNQALPNDCYKVSIDSPLVDAACIPDTGNNGLKTVKDGVGSFFAWPKNQVVLDEEVTPPTTIQKISDYNSAPKLQSKRKNYVSRETMQRQARTRKSHKSLNYGS
nr:hypothetical protein [Tanacetum cinerariifolium]